MIWLPFVLRWGDANAYSIRRLTLKTCIPEIKMSYVFRGAKIVPENYDYR